MALFWHSAAVYDNVMRSADQVDREGWLAHAPIENSPASGGAIYVNHNVGVMSLCSPLGTDQACS